MCLLEHVLSIAIISMLASTVCRSMGGLAVALGLGKRGPFGLDGFVGTTGGPWGDDGGGGRDRSGGEGLMALTAV